MSLRVAFTLIPGRVWMGGYNYLLNLAGALARHAEGEVRPVVFCGSAAEAADTAPFAALPGVEVVLDPAFDPPARRRGLRAAALTGRDPEALACFRRHGIDVLFESATFYGWRCPLPAIAWFPDFQHHHMPELFSKAAWWRREVGFRAQVLSGRTVLLSSEDARADCERAYPGARGRTAVLPFPALLDPVLLAADARAVLQDYGLPEAFAFLPGQLWKHKNHALVVEALGRLRAQGRPLTVAVTGSPSDPRHPRHAAALAERAGALGVEQDFRLLGSVPRGHVLGLLRTCSALINPSRFEGWSTTVEEAKALGVPMLLSDLAVHREQAAGLARYFDPDDATVLADLLDRHARTAPREPRQAVPDLPERAVEFARRFAGIVSTAAAGTRRAA